jgi:hypothetical protein
MPRAGFRVPVLQHVAKIRLFSESAMGWSEKNRNFSIFQFKCQTAHYQLTIRQQTTTNDYSRLQTFNQRLFLDKGGFFAK